MTESRETGDETPVRSTAPQSAFTMRDVLLGAIVLGVGLAIAYAIPGILMIS